MSSKPFFPMLKEAPPRKGFFERDQFEAVRRQLPAALQPVATFEYLTGWRDCSEVYRLTWAHVSFAEAWSGSIRAWRRTTSPGSSP